MNQVESSGLVEQTTSPSNRVQPGPGPELLELLARLLASGLGDGMGARSDRPTRRIERRILGRGDQQHCGRLCGMPNASACLEYMVVCRAVGGR